jgi:hypothetical protein
MSAMTDGLRRNQSFAAAIRGAIELHGSCRIFPFAQDQHSLGPSTAPQHAAFPKKLGKNDGPLLAEAAEIHDPVRRSRFAALAAVCHVLFPALAVQLAKMEKEIVKRGLTGDPNVFDLQPLLKGFDVLLQACKDVES